MIYISIRKLKDNKNDRKIFKEFDKKLGEFEKKLDFRLKRTGNISYNNISKTLKSPKCCILIAEYENKIIGYVVGKVFKQSSWYNGDTFGYLSNLYIDDGFREKGIGNKLMFEIMKWFKSQKVTTIKLKVFSNNRKALDFYKRRQFKNYVSELIFDLSK